MTAHTAPLSVPCPRYVKTGATRRLESEDVTYPRSVSAREREATMTKDVYLSYEECSGDVPVKPDGSFGDCPECGGRDWTTSERTTLTFSLAERASA